MIPEIDVDGTQCSEQIMDIPVPQIAERIVEVVTAFHRSESQNESLHRSSTCQDTHKVMEKNVKDSSSMFRTHRMRRLSQDTIQQRVGEQVVNKHVQQVVNSVEVKQSKITKKTVQRKNPIVQQKINHVASKRRTRSRTSTSDKLAVVPSMIQSPDPQDSAEYEAWVRQRSDRQSSIGLTSTSRFLRSSLSTKRSMRQRCYKGKFQQPKSVTENSGDASGAVYRHR